MPHESADLWALSDLATPWSLHVAVTLRIAEHLQAGPRPVRELAATVGADAESLERVLRHLVGRGVFTEPRAGAFAANDAARGLLDPGVRLALDLDALRRPHGRPGRACSRCARAGPPTTRSSAARSGTTSTRTRRSPPPSTR
ncbi:MAG: hypothetical protein R3F59_27685 [Myxococcota bacterium]